MTRVWMGIPMAMAIAGVATLAAQTPGAGAQVDNKSEQKMMTVVGCLQKGDEARGSAPTGGATSTAAQAEFVLANAHMRMSGSASGPSASSGATAEGRQNPGTAGTTGTADRANTDKAMKYDLEGRNDELVKHVGHQIEVTGSMSASMPHQSGAPGTTGTTGTTGATGAAGRVDEPQGGAGATTPRSSSDAQTQASADHAGKLQVSSIRMISANCEK